ANYLQQVRYKSHRYAQQLDDEARESAERTANQTAAATERSARQQDNANFRVLTSSRTLMRGVTELGRSIAYIGFQGSESMQHLAQKFFLVEGAVYAARSAMNLMIGTARMMRAINAGGSIGGLIGSLFGGKSEAIAGGAGEWAGIGGYMTGAGSGVGGMIAGAGGIGGIAATGGLIAGGAGLGVAAIEAITGPLGQDLQMLSGTLEDGGRKVALALSRMESNFSQRRANRERIGELADANAQITMAEVNANNQIAGLPHVDETDLMFKQNADMRLAIAGTKAFDSSLDNAMRGPSWAHQYDAIQNQAKVDSANIDLYRATSQTQTNAERRTQSDKLKNLSGARDSFQSQLDAADARLADPGSLQYSKPSQAYQKWFNEQNTELNPDVDLRGHNTNDPAVKNYFERQVKDDKGNSQSAMDTVDQRGGVEAQRDAALHGLLETNKQIQQVKEDSLQTTIREGQTAIEAAKMQLDFAEKRRDAYAQIAAQRAGEARAGAFDLATMDPGQANRLAKDFRIT
ncbi:MAG TPA: hypothetical protein VGI75_11830, partial [Pirellulales bacterium]